MDPETEVPEVTMGLEMEALGAIEEKAASSAAKTAILLESVLTTKATQGRTAEATTEAISITTEVISITTEAISATTEAISGTSGLTNSLHLLPG